MEGRHSPRLQTTEKPSESSKRLNPLEFSNVSSSVYGQSGTIFAAENLIFRSKNHFLAVFAPENLKDFGKNW